MMERTDRHFRFFLRLISRRVWLYSEMVTTGALVRGNRDRFLKFDPLENPLALQLGGSNPKALADCSAMACDYGYDEVNLNVGCPSGRVQEGRFGACLMAEPQTVADCVYAMSSRVSIPVTVKTRIGIDDRDSYEDLAAFIEKVSETGCRTFIIHARSALLNGLSPKENRRVPPLRYDIVEKLKNHFPYLEIILNGGITSLDQAESHMSSVDGVMIGREAYKNPYLLADVDRRFYDDQRRVLSRKEVLRHYIPYMQRQMESEEARMSSITRHLFGLFHAVAGARNWRRLLAAESHNAGGNAAHILAVLKKLECSL